MRSIWEAMQSRHSQCSRWSGMSANGNAIVGPASGPIVSVANECAIRFAPIPSLDLKSVANRGSGSFLPGRVVTSSLEAESNCHPTSGSRTIVSNHMAVAGCNATATSRVCCKKDNLQYYCKSSDR